MWEYNLSASIFFCRLHFLHQRDKHFLSDPPARLPREDLCHFEPGALYLITKFTRNNSTLYFLSMQAGLVLARLPGGATAEPVAIWWLPRLSWYVLAVRAEPQLFSLIGRNRWKARSRENFPEAGNRHTKALSHGVRKTTNNPTGIIGKYRNPMPIYFNICYRTARRFKMAYFLLR